MSLVKSFELIWRRNLRVLDLQMSCKGLIDSMTEYQNSSPSTMRSRYIAVMFLWRFHERHPITRDMGCRSWMQSVVEVVSLWLLFCVLLYRVIDNRTISRVNSNGCRVTCMRLPHSIMFRSLTTSTALQWRHNERDGASNHQPYDCLLNSLFRHRSKKT